jgi:hypothetical protein
MRLPRGSWRIGTAVLAAGVLTAGCEGGRKGASAPTAGPPPRMAGGQPPLRASGGYKLARLRVEGMT